MQTIDQRIAVLENAMNTIPSAIINIVLEILTELDKMQSVDKAALKDRLEKLRAVKIENGNMQVYNDLISLALSRLT